MTNPQTSNALTYMNSGVTLQAHNLNNQVEERMFLMKGCCESDIPRRRIKKEIDLEDSILSRFKHLLDFNDYEIFSGYDTLANLTIDLEDSDEAS